jgi:hypothetical protein
MTERGAWVGARPFCKITELRYGHVGREAGRGSVAGPRVGSGFVVGARAGGSSQLDRVSPSRVGRHVGPRGTKARAVGRTWLGWLVGPVGLGP